jgi:hypothetical protein
MFSIEPEFNLNSFEGATLSYKRHTSPSSAVRFGLGVVAAYADVESEREGVATDNSSNLNTGLNGTMHFMTYTRRQTPVYLYYGIGPSIDAGYVRGTTDSGSDQTEVTNRRLRAGVAVSAIVGVEWLATDWLGVVAEYGSRFGYTYDRAWSEFESSSLPSTYQTFHLVGLTTVPVRFGISVYF